MMAREEVDVRPLTPDDAVALRALRMRALQEHPLAFGTSPEEEATKSLNDYVDDLRTATAAKLILGGFVDNALVGMVHMARHHRRKSWHRLYVGAMYVATEVQGQGIGQQLMEEVIRRAQALDGIEEIHLAVTMGNERAERLYRSVGFQPHYIDSRYLLVDGQYHDVAWLVLRLPRPEEGDV